MTDEGAKKHHLQQLSRYRSWTGSRDELVCAAKRAGASYVEIITASGLSRGTVTTILSRAGLTAGQAPQEDTVLTTEPYFPHHPHLIKTRGQHDYKIYEFKPFTGNEDQPIEPPLPDNASEEVMREWLDRCSEYRAAHREWAIARYRARLKPLLLAAADYWPKVIDARHEMRKAFDALTTATVWETAVARLLAAQDHARAVMSTWADEFAFPIDELYGRQAEYVLDAAPHLHDAAVELGIHTSRDWLLGDYWRGDRDRLPTYDSPVADLDAEIETQKRRLAEIAAYSPTPE